MKVSIALDGCLWQHQAFFRELMAAMHSRMNLVGILTSHKQSMERGDLDLMVTRGFPLPDFWIGMDAEDVRHPSDFKAMAILREGIDLHFDDCDQGDPLSVGVFQRVLGAEFYRLVRIEARSPLEVHYE
jgi:hypothetical protein